MTRDYVILAHVRTNPDAEADEPATWEVFAVYETPEAMLRALEGLWTWSSDVRISTRKVTK